MRSENMKPRVIKSQEDYENALAEVERLIALDPNPLTPEGELLELQAALVEKYELEYFPFESPDPIEAILFRMEQQDLKQRDLVPYIGSRSKVSEVLSRKRTLTMSMVRALNEGLGIPAEILIQEGRRKNFETTEIEWEKFPVREMVKRGWINATPKEIRENPVELVQGFFNRLGSKQQVYALYRRTFHERFGKSVDLNALRAWCARILLQAREMRLGKYKQGTVTREFAKQVAQLSPAPDGPLLAQRYLAEHGIALVIESRLPNTRLDGTAMLTESAVPVIGLTLRYDRIDNFWHTLMHELAHVCLHLDTEQVTFLDDLDTEAPDDELEKEADYLARNIFIPREIWERTEAYNERTLSAVCELARELNIHPAIIAGRIRHDTKNFRILSQLTGNGQVRALFAQ